MSGTVHVIGAGLAGLAAAVRLAARGIAVHVHEAAPRAGGRCRSWHDAQLGITIDNGNHLLLSGNWAARAYLSEIGASDQFISPEDPHFPFFDAKSGQRWSIAPGKGPLPLWLFDRTRRVPETSVLDYAGAARLLSPRSEATVSDYLKPGRATSHFWEPLVVAALNAPLDAAAASLLTPVLRETFLRGADYCRPMVARHSLAESLIDPALARLRALGARVDFGSRIKAIEFEHQRATMLRRDGGDVALGQHDNVVLAVPAWIVPDLAPMISVPPPGQGIDNIHFLLPAPRPLAITGLVGCTPQWLFVRDSLASVTISAADALADVAPETLAADCWASLHGLLGLPPELPPYRVIRERRATFDASPASLRMRSPTRTPVANLLLAGDHVANGLPATIEGAIRSGFAAAEAIQTTEKKAA